MVLRVQQPGKRREYRRQVRRAIGGLQTLIAELNIESEKNAENGDEA